MRKKNYLIFIVKTPLLRSTSEFKKCHLIFGEKGETMSNKRLIFGEKGEKQCQIDVII